MSVADSFGVDAVRARIEAGPLVGAPMARAVTLIDKQKGAPYAQVNGDWLIELIDLATPMSAALLAILDLHRPSLDGWCRACDYYAHGDCATLRAVSESFGLDRSKEQHHE